MPLSLHLSIHFILAILTGYLAGRYFKKIRLGIILGICGGFLIDLDHVLEYFLVYGLSFNPIYFIQGREFLISDKIHLFFHAWEYLPLLLVSAWIFRKKETLKIVLITLALAGSVHLITDSFINNYPMKFYFLSYRASLDFSAQKLMSPEEYQKNQQNKVWLGI